MQRLRDSGLFRELPPQAAGSVCFQVMAEDGPLRGASIYVARRGLELHIRVGALENGRFPNNRRLYDLVVRHAHGTAHGQENAAYAYRLAAEHVGEVIEVIRAGL